MMHQLTEDQETLLLVIDLEGGYYEPYDRYELEREDLEQLCEAGLLECILNEGFYISETGRDYIVNFYNKIYEEEYK